MATQAGTLPDWRKGITGISKGAMVKSSAGGIPPHPRDPITSNPAPQGHPAHEAWERASREAEAKLFRFEANLWAERPPLGEDKGTCLIRLYVGTFQIWAERGLCIVGNHKDARAYEQWLEAYRQSWLKMLEENPPRGTVPELLSAVLRDELLRAVRHWSACALDQVAAIEARKTATGESVCNVWAEGRTRAVDRLPGTNPNVATTRVGYRTEIRAYMKGHSLKTNQEAARHFHISVATLKSIMSSRGKPRYSQDKLDSILGKIGHKKA
jgi:hypothetical protein